MVVKRQPTKDCRAGAAVSPQESAHALLLLRVRDTDSFSILQSVLQPRSLEARPEYAQLTAGIFRGTGLPITMLPQVGYLNGKQNA